MNGRPQRNGRAVSVSCFDVCAAGISPAQLFTCSTALVNRPPFQAACLLGDTGREPSGVKGFGDKKLQKQPCGRGAVSGAESGVFRDFDLPAGRQDPDLQQVIDAWPTLSPTVRKDILDMVEGPRNE